jgi:1-deoxy-D-xylulose-5-phosphate synthase
MDDMAYNILNKVENPSDLKNLSPGELDTLASDIRGFMVDTVSLTGGHLASSLGAVETTIALYKVFDINQDKVIWDVGHQAYTHKILTGRKSSFHTLRQYKGLSGFLKPSESKYDFFGAGHTSTSISAAMGFAKARDIRGEKHDVIAVLGDASLANGLSLEAINHIGHDKTDILVVVIDNEMSISPTVGALSNYLNSIITGKTYNKLREFTKGFLDKMPKGIAVPVASVMKHFEEGIKGIFSPGVLFEELGFRYFGPISGGHNIKMLVETFTKLKEIKGPKLVHIITKKGKGYAPAENNPTLFHGIGKFIKETGEPVKSDGPPPYSAVFSEQLVKIARNDKQIVAIVAAMIEGTNLSKFRDMYPDRFFDVGIAEEHAVTFAAGLAMSGFRPVVAIYSTFMQRAIDQIIHDVALQKLPVIFAMDRAGLVGEDGPTHHGVFDIVFMKMIPHMVVMAPSCGIELERMLLAAAAYKDGPVSIRFPRGKAQKSDAIALKVPVKIGRAKIVKKGNSLTIVCLGTVLSAALSAAEKVEKAHHVRIEVIDARFAKPMDKATILASVKKTKHLITAEEGAIEGGFGMSVARLILKSDIVNPKVSILGIPDKFIEHGTMQQLLNDCGLNEKGLEKAILEIMDIK